MEIIENSFPQHLSESLWQAANQHLVAKILCEFSHEKLIRPIAAKEHRKQTVQQFQLLLESNQGLLSYDFNARPYQLDHLHIQPESIVCKLDGISQDLDAVTLMLDVQNCLTEHDFWQLVAGKVYQYQHENPQFSEKYTDYNLFKAHFTRTCLNRIQLNNNQQMIDLEDREKNLRFAGNIKNPLHDFATSHDFQHDTTMA